MRSGPVILRQGRTCSLAQDGFSLLEALVALVILMIAVLTLAQIFPLATASNISARHTTHAAVLAAQKIEELRALALGFDAQGAPVSDIPVSAAEGVDYIDRSGNAGGAGRAEGPDGTVYTRRWSIEPLPGDPMNSIVMEVRVTPQRGGGAIRDGMVRASGEVRVVMVRTRKAP